MQLPVFNLIRADHSERKRGGVCIYYRNFLPLKLINIHSFNQYSFTLFFLIFINDLSDNLISNPKLFADDTSLFSVVQDITLSAKNLNDDLKKINKWAFQWKMSFNPDPNKQAQEVIFFQET